MNKLINPLLIIIFAVLLRLLPHPPNFAPIAAMALFGGVYLSKKSALIIPLIALFVSDIFLGFHNIMPYVYGSFLLTGIIGLWVRKRSDLNHLLIGALSSSILFFVITNFGVWLAGDWYPKNIAGLSACFFSAIPFFRNTVTGDLFYTLLFFGSFEFATLLSRKKVFRESK